MPWFDWACLFSIIPYYAHKMFWQILISLYPLYFTLFLTRKSSCVNARGIPPAMLTHPSPPGWPTPPPRLTHPSTPADPPLPPADPPLPPADPPLPQLTHPSPPADPPLPPAWPTPPPGVVMFQLNTTLCTHLKPLPPPWTWPPPPVDKYWLRCTRVNTLLSLTYAGGNKKKVAEMQNQEPLVPLPKLLKFQRERIQIFIVISRLL